MPQTILALEVGPAELKAAVIKATFRDYRVTACLREPISPTDGPLEEQIRRFLARHQLSADTVFSLLPGDLVTWRTLHLPFRDRRRLDQTVPFELETQVPFDLDEIVVDYLPLERNAEGSTVLAGLVRKEDLERHLEILQRAGVDPKAVDAAPVSSLAALTLAADLPADRVFLDVEARMITAAVYRNGRLLGLRALQRPTPPASTGNGAAPDAEAASREALIRELRWTLLALNGGPLPDATPCIVAATREDYAILEPLLRDALRLQPRRFQADGAKIANGADPASCAAPVGIALREVTPQAKGLNFRKGEFTYRRSEWELRRRLRVTVTLAALVIAFTAGDLYTEYRQLALRRNALEQSIQSVFRATLPDVPRVRDPVSYLRAEIQTVEEQLNLLNSLVPVSGSTSVDILRAVAAAIPSSVRLDTEEFNMDPGQIRLRGNTDSAEDVDAIKRELLATGFFSQVDVDYVRAARSGKGVDFRMTLTLSKAYRPGIEESVR